MKAAAFSPSHKFLYMPDEQVPHRRAARHGAGCARGCPCTSRERRPGRLGRNWEMLGRLWFWTGTSHECFKMPLGDTSFSSYIIHRLFWIHYCVDASLSRRPLPLRIEMKVRHVTCVSASGTDTILSDSCLLAFSPGGAEPSEVRTEHRTRVKLSPGFFFELYSQSIALLIELNVCC